MKEETIVTIGLLAIGGYVAYKLVGSSLQGVSDATGGIGGGIGTIGSSAGNVASDVAGFLSPLGAIGQGASASINQQSANEVDLMQMRGQNALVLEAQKFDQQMKLNALTNAEKLAQAQYSLTGSYSKSTFATDQSVIRSQFYQNVATTLFTNPVGSFQTGVHAISNIFTGKNFSSGIKVSNPEGHNTSSMTRVATQMQSIKVIPHSVQVPLVLNSKAVVKPPIVAQPRSTLMKIFTVGLKGIRR